MDKMTQQNAANAEESASPSEVLNAQADRLRSMVAELSALASVASARASRPPADAQSHPHRSPKAQSGGAKVVKPDDVIPMGDEDFGDF